MPTLDQKYWQERYLCDNTPWDIQSISPPIQNFIDHLTDKEIRILIPGAGKAHEAMYLHQNGFKNVYVCDWSSEALHLLQQKHPDFPVENLRCGDFFQLQLKVDLIIEQTFFCAIARSRRKAYVHKTAELLQDQGVIAGLLWSEEFPSDGPPFGGSEKEYRQLFSPHFDIADMQISPLSIEPRRGRELFVKMIRKKN